MSRDDADAYEVEHKGYVVSDDKGRLNIDAVHTFLAEDAYWSKGIDLEHVLTDG